MASRSSRPLHSKNHSSSSSILPRKLKLSNANGFSAKNTYDDVFAGPPKFGAPIFSSRVDDYAEIFGASRASSIPFLDLSALEETKNVSSDETRSSKLEYSKIFGGFGDDEQVAVYEEMFDERIRRGGKFSEKAQTPAKTVSSSEGSETLNDTKKHQEFPCEASNQSFGGVKQFNMSYQKSGQRSNSGTNGTTHVAQLHSVPGFTHFINENTPLQKTRCDESVPGSKTSINLDKNSSNGVVPGKHDKTRHLTKKQKPEGVVKHKNGLNHDAFYSNDKQFSAYDIGLKTQPSKVSPLSGMFAHKLNPIGASEGSMASNLEVPKTNTSKGGAGDCSPTFSDEDVDVNSAAAASAVALRKAIQRAQESIRIAKETMERKKDGLQSSTKPISKSSLDVKERKDNKVAGEVKRTKEKNAKGMCERVDAVLQVFAGMERQNVMRSGKVAPEFHDSEETFIGREVMNKVESADECDAQRRTPELENSNKHRTASFPFMQAKSTNNIIYSVGTDECESTGTKTSKLILGNQEENVRRAIEQSCEEKDMEKKLKVKMSEEWEEHGNILKSTQEVQEVVKSEKTVVLEDEETEEKQKAFDEQEKLEKNWKGILEQEQNEKTWIDDHEKEENGNPPEEVLKQNEIEKLLQKGCEWQNCESKLKQVCEVGSKEEQNDISKGEDNEKRLDKLYELQLEIDKTIPSDPHDRKESEEVVKEDCEWEGNEMTHIKAYKYEETASIQIETEYAEYNVETEMTQEAVTDEKIPDGYKRDANESLSEKLEANIHDDHCNIAEVSQEVIAHEENEKIRNFHDTFWEYNDDDEKELEAVKATYEPEMKETFLMAGLAESAAKHIDIENTMENATEAFFVNGNLADFGRIDSSFGQTLIGQKEKDIELASNLENGMFEHDSEENQSQGSEAEVAFDQEEEKNNLESTRVEKQWTKIGEKAEASQQPNVFEGVKKTMEVEEEIKTSQNTGSNEENSTMEEDETKGIVEKESVDAEIAFDQEEDKSNVERAHEEKHWIVMGKKMEVSRPPSVFQAEEKTMELDEEFKTSDNVEENEENLDITYTVEEKETEATAQREVTVEKELLQKIDEAKRREREREKERIAVERAIREARERAFAEARERAERAAVERATAEARQRITADAREKFEKASLRTKTSAEKASIEAKLRAERAAVERATAEARDRALEKALSQKSTSGEREKGGNFGAERFSGASRDNGTSSTDDSQRVDRANTESALGHKARLESHQRIMERAAKALAEKNRRDILAQKEQAERNRLAATLDADVKRWSSGKEGNLRALLSTLQYILEPKSGWQPVSLTDIITTNAVKKAYRKATLCVHPDKLQQRGATIPQKYICEKVFDLLKAAWNKFDSEER